MPPRRMLFTLAVIHLLVGCLPISPALQAEDKTQESATENNLLNLIPCEASFSIAIRNLEELTVKGDELIEQTKLEVPIRVSVLVDLVFGLIGVRQGSDKSQPIVISALGDSNSFKLLTAIPVADIKLMVANFGITEEQLQSGEIHERDDDDRGYFGLSFIRCKGKHVFLSTTKAILKDATLDASLAKTVSRDDQKTLAADDIVITLGKPALEDSYLTGAVNQTTDFEDELAQLMDDVQYVVSGIRLDRGIGATVIARLKSEDSSQLLGAFFDSQGDATLARMPRGKVLAAHALQADSETTGGLMGWLLDQSRTVITGELNRFSVASESSQLDGLLSEALGRVKGGHLVLYESSKRSRYGDFNLLGVLTTDDPKAFITDLTGLAPFVNAASMNETEAAQAFPPEKINELVAELGNSHYRLRELAKTKLKLLGPRARPALEKATRAGDLESRLAAKALLETLEFEANADRAEFIKGSLFKTLKPNFTYAPEQERLARSDVGILTMQFKSDSQQIGAKMETLFGPAWRTMRIATVDNKVLLLVGSETSLLEQAINNQKLPSSDLANHKACQSFRGRAMKDTLFEFHLAISRLAYLMDLGVGLDKSAANKETDRVSSVGLTIHRNQIRVDAYTPLQDIKVSVEKGTLFLP